jgi:hypothetical protein
MILANARQYALFVLRSGQAKGYRTGYSVRASPLGTAGCLFFFSLLEGSELMMNRGNSRHGTNERCQGVERSFVDHAMI